MFMITYKPMYFFDDVDCNRYDVSNIGIIKDKQTSLTLPIYQSTNGHSYVILENTNGTKKYYLLDRIVAGTFEVPVRSTKFDIPLTVNHIDDNLNNNSAENLEWVEDTVVWKTITYPMIAYGKYAVSNHGQVKNIERDHILSQEIDKDGYMKLGLYGTDKRMHLTIHRLVAFEFVKMPSDIATLSVNHIDGNKLNNHYLNLEWVNNTDNQRHAWITGLKVAPVCEEANTAILTNDQVRLLCELIVKYKKQMPLIVNDMKNYDELSNVTISMIEKIRDKKTWTAISDNYFTRDEFRQRLRPEEVREICELLLINDMNCESTLDQFNELHDYETNLRIIQRIKNKEMWRAISDEYF